MSNQSKVFLFQGDSITDVGRIKELDGLGASYAFIISSQLGVEMAEQKPVFINRGIAGDRLCDISARWNEDAFYYKPDLISILAGVNDVARIVRELPSGATDRFARFYRNLLIETRETLPNCAIVLVEPFMLKVGDKAEKWDKWSELINQYQQQVKQLAAEFDAVFVPLQEMFNEACKRADAEYWIYDGVHPTAAGHRLIAEQWLKVVSESKYGSMIKL